MPDIWQLDAQEEPRLPAPAAPQAAPPPQEAVYNRLPEWDRVESLFQQQFPGQDLGPARRIYEAGRDLNDWRWRLRGATEGGDPRTLEGLTAITRVTARRTLDFAGIMPATEAIQHRNALQRLEAGNPEPEDPYRIARVERLNELDRQATSTLGGSVWRAAQALPMQIAGFRVASGAIPGGTAFAGATGVSGVAARQGVLGLRGAATMVINDEWIARGVNNEIAHPERSALENYGTAVTGAAINGAILGQLGGAVEAIPGTAGTGLGRAATRAVIGTGVGLAEQQIADVAQSSIARWTNSEALDTGYGTIGTFVRAMQGTPDRWGRPAPTMQDAWSHALTQGMQFTAFSLLHQGGREPGIADAFADASRAIRRTGVDRQAAGRMLTENPVAEAQRTNQNLTRSEAMALVDAMPEGPVRNYSRELARTLPETSPQPVEPPRETPPVAIPERPGETTSTTLGGRPVTIQRAGDGNAIKIDFDPAPGQLAGVSRTGLQRGTLRLIRGLDEVASRLRESGTAIVYDTNQQRHEGYTRRLTRAGFELADESPIPGRPNERRYTWMPKEAAPKATGTPEVQTAAGAPPAAPANAPERPAQPAGPSPEALRQQFEVVKQVAGQLGIPKKGTRAELEAQIRKSGAGPLLDQALNPKPPEAAPKPPEPPQPMNPLLGRLRAGGQRLAAVAETIRQQTQQPRQGREFAEPGPAAEGLPQTPLSQREQFILDNRQAMTQQAIGERLGISRERVRQIEKDALEKQRKMRSVAEEQRLDAAANAAFLREKAQGTIPGDVSVVESREVRLAPHEVEPELELARFLAEDPVLVDQAIADFKRGGLSDVEAKRRVAEAHAASVRRGIQAEQQEAVRREAGQRLQQGPGGAEAAPSSEGRPAGEGSQAGQGPTPAAGAPAAGGASGASAAGRTKPIRRVLTERQKELVRDAEKMGFLPQDIHMHASELMEIHREVADEHNRILADTRRRLEEFGGHGRMIALERYEDATHVPGLDDVAMQMAHAHPEYFGAVHADAPTRDITDRLFDMLKEGNRKPLKAEQAYEQAMMDLAERHRLAQPTREDVADVNRERQAAGISAATPAEFAEVARQAVRAGEAGEGEATRGGETAGHGSGVAPEGRGDAAAGGTNAGFGRPVSDAERAAAAGAGANFRGRDITAMEAPPPADGGSKVEFRPDVTALARAQADIERAFLQLPEGVGPMSRPNKETWARTLDVITKDPAADARLVAELAAKPRQITLDEAALLLHRKIVLANEHERASLQLIDMIKPGAKADPKFTAEAVARERTLRDQNEEVFDVVSRAGTSAGQVLQWFGQLAKRDFSLLSLMRQEAIARKRPLEPHEIAELTALSEKIKKLQEALDKSEAALAKSGQGSKGPDFGNWEADLLKVLKAQQKAKGRRDNAEWSNKSWPEKARDWIKTIRVASLISGPVTNLKVGASSLLQIAVPPVREIIGSGIRLIPGLRAIAERAPVEGRGFSLATEAAALRSAGTQGFRDAWQTMRTGKSDLDVMYGKPNTRHRTVIDFIGDSHAAEKAFAVRPAFERAFRNIEAFEKNAGRDVTSPAALYAMRRMAYNESQRAKFQQDGAVINGFNKWVEGMKRSDSGLARVAGNTIDLLAPIRRTPSNIVADAFEHILGAPIGVGRAVAARIRGIDNLTKPQADSIMRMLKKGTLGLPLLALGYYAASNIGGNYLSRRREEGLASGEIRLPGGIIVPAWVTAHHPAFMALQFGATVGHAQRDARHGSVGVLEGGMRGLGATLEEAPLIREQIEVGRAFEGGANTKAIGRIARSFAIPAFLNFIAEQMDRNEQGVVPRTPYNFGQSIQVGIPGMRRNVPVTQ